MSNLRALVVSDVKELNHNDWGMPIVLKDPDGNVYNTDNETGESLMAIQVLYDYNKWNPDTGEDILVNEPVIVMSRKSLARIPLPGENWQVMFSLDPSDPDNLAENYVIDGGRSPEGGQSLGFIRLYPHKVDQI